MSSNYQIWVLKKCLALAFFTIKFIGLWPFRFVVAKGQIKYSIFRAIYSIFVLCVVITLYTIIGTISINGDENPFFGSFTLRLVITIYAQSLLVSFILTYLGQHWFATEMEIAYRKCKDIVDAMNNAFRNGDHSNYLFEIILKTIVVEILQGIVVYNNMTRSSDLMKSNVYIAIILMTPATVVRFHMNIFYVLVLTMNVYMKNLNCCLVDILAKAEYMDGLTGGKHKYLRMDNYCYFSDEIDKLTALYSKLVQGSKAFNSIFNVPIIFWNATILLTLTIQFLFQFVTIIELINKQEETVFMLNLFGILGISISCFDLMSTSYVCQRIITTVHPSPL